VIYKLCSEADWAACQRDGQLPWAPVDEADGFVHLSSGTQLAGTAAKHFRGRAGLVLLEVDPARLPEGALRWEVSRGGELFPHLYADLPHAAVVRAAAAPLAPDGTPRLPFA
jgi:uncharacterized protein (DUF952 family)